MFFETEKLIESVVCSKYLRQHNSSLSCTIQCKMLEYNVALCATIYKSKMKANISKNIKNEIIFFSYVRKPLKELRIEQHRNKNKAVVRLTYTEKFSTDLNVVISNQIYKQKLILAQENKKNSKITIFHIEKKNQK
ncbi:hypothetical protein RFI_28298, partial [Reticulomyxa filosa]